MENQAEIETFMWFAMLIVIFLALLVGFIFIIHASKMKDKAVEIQTLEKEKHLAIFKSASEAEEKQKEKIGTNLHDQIIPILSTVERSIGANVKDYKSDYFDIERLQKDHFLMSKVIEDIKGISHDLVPKTLQSLGLIEAVREYVNLIDGLNDKEAVFESIISPKKLRFSIEEQLIIYRICLELLNNLQKHTNFRYLKTIIESNEKALEIVMMHNGTGVSNEQIAKFSLQKNGLGLKSLQSRALILNATIDYTVEPKYCQITVTIPFNN